MNSLTKQNKGVFGSLKIIEPEIIEPNIDEGILHDTADAPILKECCDTIAKCYVIVSNSTECWLRMGFALIRAKSMIKHGHFMQWRAETFPNFKERHLSNAALVCQKLIEQRTTASVKDLVTLTDWDEFIDGIIAECKDSSQNGLLMTITQWKKLPNEEEYKAFVLNSFEDNPEYRDRWQPQIETGEYTWSQVAQAIKGIEHSTTEEGKRNPSSKPTQLLFDAIHLTSHRIQKIDWQQASYLEIDPIKRELGKLIASTPAAILADLSPAAKERLLEVVNSIK